MARDQRIHDNHALLAAAAHAAARKLPLYVAFSLHTNRHHRAYEHARFMLDGLEQLSAELSEQYHIPFLLWIVASRQELATKLHALNPEALYLDFSPLHGPRMLAKYLAQELPCSVTVVDSHNIIPAWVASNKQEFAAHTFRHKVHRHLASYLAEPPQLEPHEFPHPTPPQSDSFSDARHFIEKTYPRRNIAIAFLPGEVAAQRAVEQFISTQLSHYALARNDIAKDNQSNLSPYLHFGHISSLRVALLVRAAVSKEPLLFSAPKMAEGSGEPSLEDGMNALFEEMIVRKELADNFCLYSPSYLKLESAAAWAQDTLATHRDDPREYLYTPAQFEHAQTHDPAWNAAQTELTQTGKIHGYMRMYWAKKILEWSKGPEEALQIAQYLNDAYSIDGEDPNGYVGILWSIAGIHDRPWTERAIFGKVRYMNAAGLRRKFDIDEYIRRTTAVSLPLPE